MKEKYFLKQVQYNEDDLRFLQEKGLDFESAKLFFSRGVNRTTAEEYFNDNYIKHHDPFLFDNMKEAVEAIQFSIENNQSILIYGDYDADGLTASAILNLFFNKMGAISEVLIPNRSDGYGLNIDLIDAAFANKHYDLIVTVDCGISNVAEIEIIKQKYMAKIVVTDHHELPKDLPNCICINCKMGYPFKYLSGAGVAFKLVEALSDLDTALLYSDLAAVGTIADMMPLIDENRQIVKKGLANFNHKGLVKLALVCKCDFPPSASDLAMKICPKINSAGRVGDASKALRLLLNEERSISQSVEELLQCNTLRQSLLCDVIIQAEETLKNTDLSTVKMLFLYGDDWPKGILGIAANRFKESYNLPCAFLTKEGDKYIGSARGNDDCNMFDLFSSVSHLLEKFGGHQNSVGFTVLQNNLQILIDTINAKIVKHTDFKLYYDLPFTLNWLKKDYFDILNRLEPMLPNDKPIFYTQDFCTNATVFGNGNLKITMQSGLELKLFGQNAHLIRVFRSKAECRMLFTLEYDKYTESICGIINDFEFLNNINYDEIYAVNYLKNISVLPTPSKKLDKNQVKKLLSKKGVLVVFNSYVDYEYAAEVFNFDNYCFDYFYLRRYSPNCVLIAPEHIDCYNYNSVIVFSDYGNGFWVNLSRKDKVASFRLPSPSFISKIYIDRNICASVYKVIYNYKGKDLNEAYDMAFFADVTRPQFFAAVKVFEQLGILTFNCDTYHINDNVKRNLIDSSLFVYLNEKV